MSSQHNFFTKLGWFDKFELIIFEISVNVQLEKVILNFLRLAFGGDFSQKILDSLAAYRTACLDLR